MKKTLYQILNVGADASSADIDLAYRRALDSAKQAQVSDPNAALFLREAYQVLTHPSLRAAYDASLVRGQGPATVRKSDRGDSWTARADAPRFGSWINWMVGGLLLLAFVAWWQSRRPATQPAPAVVSADAPPTASAPAPGGEAAAAPRAAPPMASSPVTIATRNGERTAQDVFNQVSASVARVNVLDGTGRALGLGSGVVIGRETMITNCHVATRGAKLTVSIGTETLPARLDAADEELDLCRLSVPGMRAPAVEIGSVASLRTGQSVFAIGAPQGLDLTISEGLVSSLREVQGGTVIQTSAAISPGSSGGGLFSRGGQLVGITTFQHRYGQNLNFALPADWINQMQSRSRNAAQAAPSFMPRPTADAEPGSMVVGKWWCYGPATGRNGEYIFGEDGSTSAVVGGRPVIGNYAIRGKVLYVQAGAAVAFAIDELTSDKMVLNSGGARLVCERR